ncbi:MAG: hypothetical protein HC878_00200 [Leptolyngbyaceae cyanobacterium SL_5_14]|nr:hypothetical protein [Leptolyngbyaceae cyanobacterium SL_5_14]
MPVISLPAKPKHKHKDSRVGKPPKFGLTRKGESITTKNIRAPELFSSEIIMELFKLVQHKLVNEEPVSWNDVLEAIAPRLTIEITDEDLEMMNNRALGFVAYKLGIRPTAAEIKSADRGEVIDIIKRR